MKKHRLVPVVPMAQPRRIGAISGTAASIHRAHLPQATGKRAWALSRVLLDELLGEASKAARDDDQLAPQCVAFLVSVFACRACRGFAVGMRRSARKIPAPVQSNCTVRKR
jgi:hypothetical protein